MRIRNGPQGIYKGNQTAQQFKLLQMLEATLSDVETQKPTQILALACHALRIITAHLFCSAQTNDIGGVSNQSGGCF